jgi:hypothetical protein
MAQTQQQNLAALNMQARNAILANALEMQQLIYSQTIATPGIGNNVITVPPRNVGLIKGFWVELSGTMTESAAHNITPTELNVANFLSNITFYDLNNNLRINTPGWHMHLLNSVKGHRPYVSAFTTDNPTGFGSNMGANNWIRNPGTLNSGATASGVVRMLYWVPLAYSDRDLRGSIYANVVNATLQLVLTINPTPFVSTASDSTFAMYTTSAAGVGTLTNVTVNVYQVYFDQLPQVQGKGPFLPILDLSTIYEMKTTSLTGMTVNQDFPVPYANFREFISTIMMYDNGNSGTTLFAGTDINYIALQSANFTNIFKLDPYLLSMQTRQIVQDDFPIGTYYIDHRRRPISTVQYGNMELIVNPSTVNSGAQLLTCYEDFAIVNTVTGAGSLPAG